MFSPFAFMGGEPIIIPSSSDADVQSFYNAVYTGGGSLSTTEQEAIETLVSSMKSSNVWDGAKAMYPLVGGTQASCKVNLKTPGTNDINFETGWGFDATGATNNGVEGDTGIPVASSTTYASYGIYVGNATEEAVMDFGGIDYFTYPQARYWGIGAMNLSSDAIASLGEQDFYLRGFVDDSLGWTYVYHVNGIEMDYLQRNGVGIDSRTNTGASTGNATYKLRASTRNYRFVWLGNANTTPDFYNTIQTFQTNLNRQV